MIEVLLVVDGPQAATLGFELDALNAASPRLRVLRLPAAVGGEVARRIGAEAALGGVVWFLDDDVVPDAGTALGHASRHADTAAHIVVGPLATPSETVRGVARVFAWLYDESFRHEWARQVANPSEILKALWGGNYSVSRARLLELEAVPAVFKHTRHFDRAFGLACARAGMTAVCAPELAATHDYAPPLERWRQDCRRQGAGRVAIHQSFADLLEADVPHPWRVGLGRRGRVALRIAQSHRLVAGFVADVLAIVTRTAVQWNLFRIGLETGRVLRSVEQARGAAAWCRQTGRRLDDEPGLSAVQPADVSLLVISRGPSARLRRVLEVWRPCVAEIVVVADLSGEAGLIDAVADLADRTATVRRAFPIESVLDRCWPLCGRSFVFRCDDDEVPTTVLLAELRSLTLDATLQQAGIPKRWLWPSAGTWIDAHPWAANPQPKLIRNLAGLIHFPGRVHTTEHLLTPPRQVPLPIYHLRTLDSVADRRERSARYVEAGGRHRHVAGPGPNAQYLPEEAGELPLKAVPPWDAAMVARVAEVSARSGSEPATANAPAHQAAAVVPPVLGPQPRLATNGRGASVRVMAIHPPVSAGGCLVLEVVIANRSDAVLPGASGEGTWISLSTRWQRLDGQIEARERVIDGQRFGLGEPIPPGRAVARTLALELAVDPGRWRVTVDLVEESIAWFGDGDEFVVEVAPTTSSRRLSPDANLFQAILIETRNTCNRRCWFCKFGQDRRDPHVEVMDWDTIRRILANLKALDYGGRVSWHGINEPLIEPRIFDILEETRAACPHAFISLVTNGDLLTPEKYERLKNSLDVVGVSLYDDEVLNRVRRFADAQMQLIDMRTAAPGRLENRGGTVLENAALFVADQLRFADTPCERPSFMMSVKATGKVALCCADMYGDVLMGDVREQRLEEIWYGERFVHYRRTLESEGRRNLPLCQACSYNGQAGRVFYPLPHTVTHPKVEVARVYR